MRRKNPSPGHGAGDYLPFPPTGRRKGETRGNQFPGSPPGTGVYPELNPVSTRPRLSFRSPEAFARSYARYLQAFIPEVPFPWGRLEDELRSRGETGQNPRLSGETGPASGEARRMGEETGLPRRETLRLAEEAKQERRWASLEWKVLQLWQEALEERFVLLHAGVVRHPGGGAVILPGRTGTGKTTFTLALVSRGWTYFSDDCATLDPATWELYPVPGAAHVRGLISSTFTSSTTSPTSATFPRTGLWRRAPTWTWGSASVLFGFPRWRHLPKPGEKSPLRALLFPAFDQDTPPPGEAAPLPPGMAAYELVFHSMARNQDRFLRDFRAVCELARRVPAFRISTRDLDRACTTATRLIGA